MTRILAIAAIAMRNALRSRIVVCLLLLLALVLAGLPLTLKGDGSPEGQARILVQYTLGFAGFLIALATLWSGCAAISSEIDRKQIQMIVSKPVRRIEIWLGKWLGLVALAGILLTFSGLTTYALLRWRMGEAFGPVRTATLDARESLRAEPVRVEEQARALLRERLTRGDLPPNLSQEDAFRAIREQLRRQAFTVPPGAFREWTFRMPEPMRRVTVRYRFAASHLDLLRVRGVWSTPADRRETHSPPNAWQQMELQTDGATMLVLRYANTDERAVTVLFDPDDGAQILRPVGSFESNYLRALLLIWVHLAFLAALGLSAGSVFSMPVASFASLYAMVLLATNDYVANLARTDSLLPWRPGGSGGGPVETLLRDFYRTLAALIGPLQTGDPLGHVVAGEWLSWGLVFTSFAIKTILYGGALALGAAWVLNRREVALPS